MKTLLAAVVLVASGASAQVAVLPPRVVNFEPERAQALATVCAQAYEQASGQSLVPAADMDTLPKGVTEVLDLSLVGLDGARTFKILISGARKTPQGQLVYAATIEALSLDEAPMVCARLADALVRKEPIEVGQTHSTVTKAEASKRSRRQSSTHAIGLKAGMTAPFAYRAQLAPIGSLGFDMRFEVDRWLYEVALGFMIPGMTPGTPAGIEGYGGIWVDLGASYYLTDTDFAPYVGGGLEPRLVFSGSGFNMLPYVQVGATFSRKSSVRVYAEARVGQNVLPVLSSIYPTEVSLNLGLGF